MTEERPKASAPIITNAATLSRSATLARVAIVGFALLYTFPYYPKLNNPNENARLYMTAAIVESGTYRVDAIRERWGWVNDCACVERFEDGTNAPCVDTDREGERAYYSVKAPGTSLLGVPGYFAYQLIAGEEVEQDVATWVVRVTASVLPFLCFLFFLLRWLSRFTRSPALRDVTFFGLALGSVLCGYSLIFASHTQSAICAFGAFMLLFDAEQDPLRRTHGRAFVAGLLAASASLFEYPCFFISLLLSIYSLLALRRFRYIAGFVVGALIPVALLMHFQGSAFDNPLSPGHLFVENPAFRQAHEEGFFGASTIHWDAAWKLLVHRKFGLIATSPLLAFAVPGLFILLRRRATRLSGVCVVASCAATYLLICTMNNWRGGWVIGPRYLVALIPFCGWAALIALNRLWLSMPRIAAGLGLGGLVGGFAGAGLVSVYYPHFSLKIDAPVADVILTFLAHDWAPMNAGNLIGLTGTLSMVPVFSAALLALLLCVLGVARERRVPSVVFALLVGGALVAVHAFAAPPDAEAEGSVAHIFRGWPVSGSDRAARLEATLTEAFDPVAAGQLIEIYEREHRDREASRVRRKLVRHEARSE